MQRPSLVLGAGLTGLRRCGPSAIEISSASQARMPSWMRRRRRNSLGACSFSSAVENEKNSVFAPMTCSNRVVAGSVPAMTASSTSSPG